MENQVETLQLGQWVIRLRMPSGQGPYPVILLFHGLTGDENSMWIFASKFPRDSVLLAPRGLYASPLGGFTWYPPLDRLWPSVNDFRPAIDALFDLLTPENFPTIDFSRMRAVGFSQGAAMTYTLGLLYPEKLNAFAGLSGFLPEETEALVQHQPLKGKHVFVAHGTQDEMVPVERARHAVQLLEQAGASVSYCEDDVGHKLSATCFRSLQMFFTDSVF